MESIFFGNESAGERFYLHGVGTAAPIRGAVRQIIPLEVSNDQVEESITIECKAGDIRGLITWLERRFARLEDGLDLLYLWFTAELGSTPIGSRIMHGRLEALGSGSSDRIHGYQGLKLRLVRDKWLAEVVSGVRLQNANGSDNVSGLTVYNHSDNGSHVNTADVRGEYVGGSQPVPARVVIDGGSVDPRRIGKIVLSGGTDLWDAAGAFNHVLEGESAAAGAGCTAMSTVSSLTASGGYYQNLQWTATTEVAVCRWSISGVQLGWLRGRGVKPAARFHSLPPANTRLRWKILSADSGSVLDQSSQVVLNSASQLQVLPAFFPPVPASLAPFQGCLLEAWLECPTAGTKQIDLDFVHLFPLENFTVFEPLGGLDQNSSLVMDWAEGECYSESNLSGERTVTHQAAGEPLVLIPERNHRIYLVYETDPGFWISDTVKLRLQAGARWLEP